MKFCVRLRKRRKNWLLMNCKTKPLRDWSPLKIGKYFLRYFHWLSSRLKLMKDSETKRKCSMLWLKKISGRHWWHNILRKFLKTMYCWAILSKFSLSTKSKTTLFTPPVESALHLNPWYNVLFKLNNHGNPCFLTSLNWHQTNWLLPVSTARLWTSNARIS